MRVCNIEKVDNGFIVQNATPADTEETGIEGIFVTQDPQEALSRVAELLGMVDAITTAAAAPVAAAAAPTNVAEAGGVPAPSTPADKVAASVAAAAPAIPAAVDAPPFGSAEYVEEMNRLLADNDRKEIKRRLDAHIADNVIEEYNKNCKAKSLLQILYNADQSAAGQTALPLDPVAATPAPVAAAATPTAAAVPTAAPVSAAPAQAPVADMAVPPPSGVDTGTTLQQVGEALSGAGQRLGQERMAEVYAVITGSQGIGGAKPTKVSEIDPAFYQNVINQANTLA